MAYYKIIGVQVNSEQDALLQKYIRAVQIIQQGSNVDMYDGWDGTLEEKYNYNNVWHLVKREGNLDHWILTYEGKHALEMQESLILIILSCSLTSTGMLK